MIKKKKGKKWDIEGKKKTFAGIGLWDTDYARCSL